MSEQAAESRKILIRELETSQQETQPLSKYQSNNYLIESDPIPEGKGCNGTGEDGGGEGDFGEGQRARLGGAGHPTGAGEGEKHDDQRGPHWTLSNNIRFRF